jgi:hypothetical protein
MGKKKPGESSGLEITVFSKAGGPLTKEISLAKDGTVISDGSACVMSSGEAERVCVAGVEEFAALIGGLRPNQAIALGTLRGGVGNKVEVVTKIKLNGVAQPNIIARTSADIIYRTEPTFALLDFDSKGMPAEVKAKIKAVGGFWPALLTVLPALCDVACVTRRSTSAGLIRSDTKKQLPGSDGLHVYVTVQDGTDIERFLKTLHDRCWLAGFGWTMVGAGGQLLVRSIVDRMVGGAERLVFEGGPILKAPLKQDCNSRRPVAVAGDVLDTITACPPLSIVENAKLTELKAKEAHRLAGEVAKVREAFIKQQAKRLVERTGMAEAAARIVIERQCEGVLLPDIVLPFDDDEFADCTVGDVLADPDHFDGATLADPLEGVDYGRCKAKIMRRSDGTPWIHSFAHGRTIYALKYDASAVRKAMEAADKDDVVKMFVKLAMIADLDAEELETLRRLAKEISGIGLRQIDSMLKAAQEKQSAHHAKETRKHHIAERRDPRPLIKGPFPDEPWLPEMDVINEIVGGVIAAIPPLRNIDGITTRSRKLPVPDMHAFTQSEANIEGETI